MKSWADHCSSDEESDDGLHPARLASMGSINEKCSEDLSYDEDEHPLDIIHDDDIEVVEEKIPYPAKVDFNNPPIGMPTKAPYTAYIRNLAFNIATPADLADKIEGMTKWRYNGEKRVTVTSARLGTDRNTGKRKGFGYVEFETPEELMLFLNLNDGHSRLNGRFIGIDIAQNKSRPNNNNGNNNNRQGGGGFRHNDGGGRGGDRGGVPDIDGRQFRGGRFSSRNNNQSNSGSNSSDAGPAERRSLKLAPRTRPSGGASGKTKSNIFGDAKPRDESNWRKAPKAETNAPATTTEKDGAAAAPAATATSNSDNNGVPDIDGRQFRGGRGDKRQNQSRGGRGGRGGANRRGSRNSKNMNSNNANKGNAGGENKDNKQTAAGVPTSAIVQDVKKGTVKVTNAFAALGFDDSDSD